LTRLPEVCYASMKLRTPLGLFRLLTTKTAPHPCLVSFLVRGTMTRANDIGDDSKQESAVGVDEKRARKCKT
ncbi:hypothetical protein CI238_10470, partial [Colletotrichum incanum]